jgi:hypothetical protein
MVVSFLNELLTLRLEHSIPFARSREPVAMGQP